MTGKDWGFYQACVWEAMLGIGTMVLASLTDPCLKEFMTLAWDHSIQKSAAFIPPSPHNMYPILWCPPVCSYVLLALPFPLKKTPKVKLVYKNNIFLLIIRNIHNNILNNTLESQTQSLPIHPYKSHLSYIESVEPGFTEK